MDSKGAAQWCEKPIHGGYRVRLPCMWLFGTGAITKRLFLLGPGASDFFAVSISSNRQNNEITLPIQKSYSPFALIAERICYGIVSTTLCNVKTFISILSCLHFWPKF